MNYRTKIWGLTVLGTCLIVPFTIIYWRAGSLDFISFGAIMLASYLFYSDAYIHLRDGKEE